MPHIFDVYKSIVYRVQIVKIERGITQYAQVMRRARVQNKIAHYRTWEIGVVNISKHAGVAIFGYHVPLFEVGF